MTRKKSQYWNRPKDAPPHPYREFEGTPLWNALKKAIIDLDENQDLELTEWHQYIIGYICKKLSAANVVSDTALTKK